MNDIVDRPALTLDPILGGYAAILHDREVTQGAEMRGASAIRHVLVCGHGRGGTTAVSKILIELGFTTDEANPFLESVPLRVLNKTGEIDSLLTAIRAWDTRDERMFWKDPKIKASHMLPLLPKLPESIGFIFVFRDPLNVAIRNDALGGIGVMPALSQAIKGYSKLLGAIEAVRHRAVFLMSYEKLLTTPQLLVPALSDFLNIEERDAVASAISVIEPNSVEYRTNVAACERSFSAPVQRKN